MCDTITLTFGEICTTFIGMEESGKTKYEGFTTKDLEEIKSKLESKFNSKTKLLKLSNFLDERKHDDETEEATVLLIPDGVSLFTDKKKLLKEQQALDVDKKALMRGRVVNKRARYNLCFADYSQEADHSNGKGKIVNFSDTPFTSELRKGINELINSVEISTNVSLLAEGNYYYDINKCGIGYHGDTERGIVIGARLGKETPLCFKWYNCSKPISKRIRIKLKEGDMYIFSKKATGHDWKKRSKITLRHAAGCEKFIN